MSFFIAGLSTQTPKVPRNGLDVLSEEVYITRRKIVI